MSLPEICRCHQVPNNPDCHFHGHLVNVAAPSGLKPVEINCIEWMDALAESWERRAPYCNHETTPEAVYLTCAAKLRYLSEKLRACGESASIGADERPAPARKD